MITPAHLGGDCAGHPHPDWWYANPGTQQWRDAKAICAGCPMTVACYATALGERIEYGIWGGVDMEHDRKRRQR